MGLSAASVGSRNPPDRPAPRAHDRETCEIAGHPGGRRRDRAPSRRLAGAAGRSVYRLLNWKRLRAFG